MHRVVDRLVAEGGVFCVGVDACSIWLTTVMDESYTSILFINRPQAAYDVGLIFADNISATIYFFDDLGFHFFFSCTSGGGVISSMYGFPSDLLVQYFEATFYTVNQK